MDYCTVLNVGLPLKMAWNLVQNAEDKLLSGVSFRCHITPFCIGVKEESWMLLFFNLGNEFSVFQDAPCLKKCLQHLYPYSILFIIFLIDIIKKENPFPPTSKHSPRPIQNACRYFHSNKTIYPYVPMSFWWSIAMFVCSYIGNKAKPHFTKLVYLVSSFVSQFSPLLPSPTPI